MEWHPGEIEMRAYHEHVVEVYARFRAIRQDVAIPASPSRLPPSPFLQPVSALTRLWGQYVYDGTAFAPRGVRSGHTLSWFINMSFDRGCGWSVALVPFGFGAEAGHRGRYACPLSAPQAREIHMVWFDRDVDAGIDYARRLWARSGPNPLHD